MFELQAEHQTNEGDLFRCSTSTLAAALALFRDKHNRHGGWCAVRRGHRAGPNLLYSGAFKRELRHLAAEGVDLTANGIYSLYIVGDPRASASGAFPGDSAAKSAVVSSSASAQQSFE